MILTMTSTPEKTLVLVTGSNQGLGFQVAKTIVSGYANHHVLMGCRDAQRGHAAAEALQQQGHSVENIMLDVTVDASVISAAEYVQSKYGKLDVLINNAGIGNESSSGHPVESLRAIYGNHFDTNLFGAALVTEVFSQLLEKSPAPRVVFTSSVLGSLTQRAASNDRFYSVMLPAYRTSKAALNMLCLHYATKYKEAGWKVNTVDPGHVATNLNRYKGPDSVESGAIQLVRMATLGPDGPTGTFSSKEGIVPW